MALRIPLKFLPCVLVAMLSGCGGGGSEGPPLYSVKGTLTKGGQPLPGITVTFVNQDQKILATGLTNEAGAFVLIAESGKPGMAAGKAKVTLVKAKSSSTGGATAASDPTTYYQNMAKSREGGQRGAPPKEQEEELPFSKDYTDIEKTPLSFEVKTSSNEFEIPIP